MSSHLISEFFLKFRRCPENIDKLLAVTLSADKRQALQEAKEYLSPSDCPTIQRMSEVFRDMDKFHTIMLDDE